MNDKDFLDDLLRHDLAQGVEVPEDLNQKVLAMVKAKEERTLQINHLGLMVLSSLAYLLSLALIVWFLRPYLGRLSLPITFYCFTTSLASTLVLALVLISERSTKPCISQV